MSDNESFAPRTTAARDSAPLLSVQALLPAEPLNPFYLQSLLSLPPLDTVCLLAPVAGTGDGEDRTEPYNCQLVKDVSSDYVLNVL